MKIICPFCGYDDIHRLFLYDDKYCSPSKWGTKGILTACGKCFKTVIIEKETKKCFKPDDWYDYSILKGIPKSITITDNNKAFCDKHKIELDQEMICKLCFGEENDKTK